MKIKYLIDTLLSNDIKALDFVERYGGMVSTIHTKQDDFEANGKGMIKRYPVACDVNNVDCANIGIYQDLVPNDEKKSIVYWEELSPMANVGETATKSYYQRRFRGTARLVFWANLAKLGDSTCGGNMMAMQLELERIIARKAKISGGLYNDSFIRILPSKDVPQDINSVFGKYDYPKELNYYLYPFGFFAIDIEFEIDYCIATGATVPVNPPIDCYNGNLTDCQRILAMLTNELKLTCVLPTYDFADPATLDALTPQQEADLETALCDVLPATCPEILAFVASVRVSCIIPSLVYTTGNDADFDAFNNTQKNDLSMRLCGVPDVAASMVFDGVNDNVFGANLAAYDFNGTTPFSFALWVKPSTYAGLRGVFSKRVNAAAGYSAVFSGGFYLIDLVSVPTTNQIQVRWSLSALTANIWHRFLITYNGSKQGNGVNFYIDGVLQVQNAPLINNLVGNINSGALVAIGRNSATGSQWFSGKQEDVTIWNKELNQLEATADSTNATIIPTALANVVFNMPGGQGAVFSANSVFTMRETSGLSSVVGKPYSSLMTLAAYDSADVPN